MYGTIATDLGSEPRAKFCAFLRGSEDMFAEPFEPNAFLTPFDILQLELTSESLKTWPRNC